MKKNAQSVAAWLEAMIAVARHYRLDFSQENVRATVNWERDSKREALLTDMARQLGMGLRLAAFSADSLNPWRLPLIAVFDNQQIGVITRRDNHDNISIQFSGDEGLETTLNVADIEDNIVELALLARSAPSLMRVWMTISVLIRPTGSGVCRSKTGGAMAILCWRH